MMCHQCEAGRSIYSVMKLRRYSAFLSTCIAHVMSLVRRTIPTARAEVLARSFSSHVHSLRKPSEQREIR